MKSAYDFWVNASYHEIPTSKSEGLGLYKVAKKNQGKSPAVHRSTSRGCTRRDDVTRET